MHLVINSSVLQNTIYKNDKEYNVSFSWLLFVLINDLATWGRSCSLPVFIQCLSQRDFKPQSDKAQLECKYHITECLQTLLTVVAAFRVLQEINFSCISGPVQQQLSKLKIPAFDFSWHASSQT